MRLVSIGSTLALSMACSILLAACGNNDKAVSFESGGVTHTFTEGKSGSDFPLPVYPGSQTTGSVEAKGNADEQSKFLMITSTDSIEAISQFYQDKLKENGWTIEQKTILPTLVNIAGSKNDQEASVMISQDDKKVSNISLQVSQVSKDPTGTSNQTYVPDKNNPPTD